MKLLSLDLPGGFTVNPGPNFNAGGQIPVNATTGRPSLGDVLTAFAAVALYAGAALMFIWLIWGVYQYMIAEGNKEDLAKAKARMRWALIGFVILVVSYFISDYIENSHLPGVLMNGITPLSYPK